VSFLRYLFSKEVEAGRESVSCISIPLTSSTLRVRFTSSAPFSVPNVASAPYVSETKDGEFEACFSEVAEFRIFRLEAFPDLWV
jgi:hypothetical protein